MAPGEPGSQEVLVVEKGGVVIVVVVCWSLYIALAILIKLALNSESTS